MLGARSLASRLNFDPARLALAALALAAALLAGCPAPQGDAWTAEAVHLVAAAPGAPAPTYTLADETRPVLAAPAETHLQLWVPPDAGETFTFALPATVGAGDVIVTGLYQRQQRSFALTPATLAVAPGPLGGRLATMVLPPLARGPGPPTTLTLILTTRPPADATESRVDGVVVPPRAKLELAYGLSEAAGLAGAAPVRLEVLARDDAGEHALWTTELHPPAPAVRRWHEATIGLGTLAGRRVSLLFRARSAGAGRPAVFPLWADPTLVVPAARAPERRNVVLVSIDTLRADRVGVYGAYRPTTPAIDALAAESVVFTDAWAPWPETSGSHMSLFTSRFPSEHGVTSFISAPAAAIELLAERLRREGYLTRAFTEDGGVWANAGFARGFGAYGERRSFDFVYRGEAALTFGDAAAWIEAHAARTFFLFVHTYQVHAPYDPPREYRTLFEDVPGREPAAQARNAIDYDREVRFTDDQIGPLVATLQRLGLAGRTLLILTSDHGEEFGEHGGSGHGRTLHREVLHVPLVLWAPGLLAPARVTAPASLLDVAPTVLELLGLAPDPGYRGTSLAALARGDTAPAARPIFGEVDREDRIAHDHVRFVSVRAGGRAAIADLADGSTRCYAADDPAEQRPGGDCPDLVALLARHRQSVQPVGPGAAPTVDPRLMEKMRALGYVD